MRPMGKRLPDVCIVLAVAAAVAGCASDPAARRDPFFEKWNTLAEQAQGSSPAPRDKAIVVSESAAPEERMTRSEGIGETRLLPSERISLKMRQADVKSVLRSLARTVNVNILVKNDVKGEITVDFKDTPWDQAFRGILRTHGLEYGWEGSILRVMSVEDMEHELKVKAVNDKRLTQAMEGKRVEPFVTSVIPVDYANADQLRENLQEFLMKDKDGKPRGSVKVDKHSNSLIVQAIRDDLNKMLPVIEKIDKPTAQILIKANIVETSKEMARNLGIQWGGMYGARVGGQSLYVTPGGVGTSASTTPPGTTLSGGYAPVYGDPGISGHGFGVNFPAAGMGATASGALGLLVGTIGGNILDVQLSALQKDGKLNILSSPSITTLDNQMAFTENGEKIPYVTTETVGGATTRTVKFEDAVLRLEITPHVIDGDQMKMEIVVKKDAVDDSRKVEGNPYIVKKMTKTNLIAQNGETIVISGLTKQTVSGTDTGIPGAKEIPLFGWLFKSDAKKDNMEEVLIFITPQILPMRKKATASRRLIVEPAPLAGRDSSPGPGGPATIREETAPVADAESREDLAGGAAGKAHVPTEVVRREDPPPAGR